MIKNQKSKIEWTPYLATAYAEGFCEGEGAPLEEQIEAWCYLHVSKVGYSLQGWFGRNLSNLLEQKIFSNDGTIDWELVDAIKQQRQYEFYEEFDEEFEEELEAELEV